MSDKPDASPFRAAVQPLVLVGVFVAVASLAGLAMTADAGKAQATIAVAFVAVGISSLVLIGPFLASFFAPAWGPSPVPPLGVRAAAVGFAGFAALFGLAVARPIPEGLALIGLAVGLGLITLQFHSRFRYKAE